MTPRNAPPRAPAASGISSLFSTAPLQSTALTRTTWVGMTVLLLMLFGLSDVLTLVGSDWPHLTGVVGVPLQRWEETVVYLPFAEAFSLRNPLPIAPAFDKSLTGSSVYPWISFALSGALLKGVCLGNTDLYLLVAHTVPPVLSFWLIYLVYRRHISRTWAILLAFFGVTYFSGFHYAEGVRALLGGAGSLFPSGPPEITRTPFPSLSLLLFLVPFTLTVRSARLDGGRVLGLGFLWALQIYVYFFNFVAGAAFFVLWLVYARWVTDRGFRPGKLAASVGAFLGICAVLGAPYYAAAAGPLGEQLAEKLFTAPRTTVVASNWGLAVAYGLPLLLLAVPFFLFQGDRYELFYRCMPVLLALVVDLGIGSLHLVIGPRLDPELYFHRISHILFRFFYFVPFLYFISLPEKALPPTAGRVSRWLHHTLPGLLRRYVHRFRLLYSAAGIGLLSVFIIASSIHRYHQHERRAAEPMEAIQSQALAADAAADTPGSIVACESVAANLLVPATTEHAGLLVSAFGNFVDESLILERLVLYGKLFDWSEEEFLAFMLPHEPFVGLSSYGERVPAITQEMLHRGLGFWLLHHRTVMTADEREQYRAELLRAWRQWSREELLERHPVQAVVPAETAPSPVE
jgi:hypothetical protein